MIGETIGRYRIVAKLGEGGMGEVYAAEHVSIHKRVAIKLLRPEITSNEEAVRRFEQEAQSSSSIGHENIIGIDDFGTMPDGRIFLFMELLEGEPLNEMLDQPMDPARLLGILIQSCHGLRAAHQKGIVHRDMKPENIFVTQGDVPKLLDFGIAKVSQGEGENHLTRTGTIFGTPFYMAPEQALGQNVDHRVDIYAMGVIMYECFCGSVPFQGDSFMGILTQHITAEPMPPGQMAQQHGRMLPPGVAEIIGRCMAKDAGQRYQTMDELIQALVAVHRAIAGAGMSAYIEAQPQPGPVPGSAPYPHPAHGSQPAMVTPMPASGPGQGTMPSQAAYAQESSVAIPAPGKKGKGGVILVVILLLLAGGGVGGYLYWDSQQKQEVAGGGSDDGQDSGGDATGDSSDNPLVAGGDGDGDSDGDGDGTGDGTAANSGDLDAGALTTPDAMPAAKPIFVLVDSSPDRAAVFRGGEQLKDRTPTNIKVIPGQPVELELKRRGFRDKIVTIDGSETKVTIKLDRIRRVSHGGKDPKGGDSGNKDPKDGDGGKGGKDTAQPKRCTPKWCKNPKNSSAPCCMLE